MNPYQKLKTSTEQTQERKSAGIGCAAHGCPLAGAIAFGTTGNDAYYCRYHAGKRPSDNDNITQRLRLNTWLIDLADHLCRPEIYHQGTDKVAPFAQARDYVTRELTRRNKPDLLQLDEEIGKDNRVWAKRLLTALSSEIESNVEKIVPIALPAKTGDSANVNEYFERYARG